MTIKHSRPTSPHLQIYKLPLTGLISITHRITGVCLSAGLLLVVAIFYSLSQGAGSYAAMQNIAHFWLVKAVYWGFIYALFFHLCHGIRHLYWDVGEGFEQNKLFQYALFELMWALALTVGTWFFI
ncbi:MAG: succinate dehydrogenase, cytochrome b556 subunit [Methylococcaceae bacterium]|nr:succinate dehydrogenase, cytochrome b556 subunit [Methylococcaceae bacterium]